MRCIKNFEIDKSAIAEHSYNTSHTIEYDNLQILATVNNYCERKIMEASL